MEYLAQFFSQIAGDPALARWLLAGSIGLAAALFGLGTLVVVTGVFDPFRRRLQAVSGGTGKDPAGLAQLAAKIVEPIGAYVLPKSDVERSSMRGKLVHAGFSADRALLSFYAAKLMLLIVVAAAVVLGAPFFPGFGTTQVMTAALWAGGVAMFLPNLYVTRRAERRKRAIMNGFPDVLDLLVTCTEAGLGLNAAIQRVAEELVVSHEALALELALVNAAIQAGVERTDALKALADRTGLDDIRGLVSLLCQSVRFGTSIGDTLRIYSEEFRDKRMQRAEEAAAKIGTKMIFPMVFCLWPSFFLVAVGPAVLAAIRALHTTH
ncbi:MAG: type II secretion system F family protein [Gammaproteobacteria bacterium]